MYGRLLNTFYQRSIAGAVLLCITGYAAIAQANTAYNLPVDNIRIRDPFIVVDRRNKCYYTHANQNPHFKVYKSKDLKNWQDGGSCFTAANDFWGKSDFWAPDVYAYKGKYYMLATFSAPGKKRGTSILVGDSPAGPFQPLVNGPVTPADMMCLDGTLYIDKHKKPWIIYAHEWLEAKDGRVLAQRLSADLKTTIGAPVELFTAAKAPWVKAISGQGVTGYVTDAPFPYRTKNGQLLMLWSSFDKNGQYAIGIVRSESGDITGPWIHDAATLNDDNGGHAMLFYDLAGKLRISYHAPNNTPQERLKIYEVKDEQGQLTILK